MYCGSCLYGNTLTNALRAASQDVVLVPAYTPLRTDEEDASIDRVVLGGVNVYLQQRSAFFRNIPWFFDRFLDQPRLLRWFGNRGTSTKPEHLGSLRTGASITVAFTEEWRGSSIWEVVHRKRSPCWL